MKLAMAKFTINLICIDLLKKAVPRRRLLILLCFLVMTFANLTPERRLSSRVVRTKYGGLRGYITTLPNKSLQSVEVFLGIPYASPPVGKLRFMPPVTPAIWSGTRSAHTFGPVCPQKTFNITNETEALKTMTAGRLNILKRIAPALNNQSEDCLYLNIYTPAVVGREPIRLPVMMFIHGESYEWNAGSSYDGSVLASFANVVVVTINYRLGVLGFFPLLDGTARGNFGLMDQVAALHWIQENIAEFGGDPSNVTIMGHGHGAACVNFLMLSPMARGLFHRAIMQSGSALSPWAIATEAVANSRKLASELGCPDEPDKTSMMVDCLRQRSIEEIIDVDFKVPTHLTAFGPVIDGIVVPNDPAVLMADHHSLFGSYDLLFGVTKIESYNQFTMLDELHGIDPQRRDQLLRTLVRNLFNFHLQEIFLTIVNEYTDWTRPPLHPASNFDSIADSFSDGLVAAPIVRSGLMHAKLRKNTFFYHFAYQTEDGDFNSRLGCVHGQDLAYIFGAPLVNGMQLSWFTKNFSRAEASLSEAVMTYWTNFARTGDPNSNAQVDEKNGKSRDRFEKVVWLPYEEVQQQYLTITMKPKTRDHYHAHRLSYWLNLIPKLHVPGPPSIEEHHLLEAHGDPLSYDGIVRENSMTSASSHYHTTQSSGDMNMDAMSGSTSNSSPSNGANINNNGVQASNPTTLTGIDKLQRQNSALDNGMVNTSNASVSMIVQQGSYSTALSVTIAIGCSLLILNVLVFAGVFYQRDKNRLENRVMNRNYQVSKMDELSMTKNPMCSSPLRHPSGSSSASPSTVDHHANAIAGDCVHGITTVQKHSHNPMIISQQPPSPLSCRTSTMADRSSAQVSMANNAFHCNSIRTFPRGEHKASVNVINTSGQVAFGHPQRHVVAHEMRV